MSKPHRQPAPSGDLATYERTLFQRDGFAHEVFRKGSGPAVLVLTELPCVSPQVFGFADRLVALGCTAIVPSIFGEPGRDALEPDPLRARLYAMSVVARACISREFSTFALGKSSPIVTWLRSLAAFEHERCGGPGVGVVGMCFTGGFALAMASDPRVLAPVVSQPSLPFSISKRHKRSIDCSDEDLSIVANRCARDGLRVLGLRFAGDPFVPAERFQFLAERLGDGFVAVELPASSRHPKGPLAHAHSVLTGDLIDEPHEPTREALERVLALFREKLLSDPVHAPV
jgi:dienelactone hydrolase